MIEFVLFLYAIFSTYCWWRVSQRAARMDKVLDFMEEQGYIERIERWTIRHAR